MQVVADLEEGEIAREAIDVAAAAVQGGWRAVVASAGGPLERDLLRLGGAHCSLPSADAGLLAAARSALAMRQTIRRWRPDVVHARDPSAARGSSGAARAARVRFVTTARVIDRNGRGLVAADRIIAPSEFAQEELSGALTIDKARLPVVRRWLDAVRFDPAGVRGHRVAALAERSGVAAGPKVVLVDDHVVRHGGITILVEALARVTAAEAVVLFLGDLEPDHGAGRMLLAGLQRAGLAERCRFARTDDLPAALMLADLVVEAGERPLLAYRHLAAAQAMGRPVVATDTGAAGETFMPAATGWLVPQGDAAELARAIDLALAMPEAGRERLATRARALALERFGAAAQIERELAIYEELLDARPAAASSSRAGGTLVTGA